MLFPPHDEPDYHMFRSSNYRRPGFMLRYLAFFPSILTDSSAVCGGAWANTVYKIEGLNSTSEPEREGRGGAGHEQGESGILESSGTLDFLGCFRDGGKRVSAHEAGCSSGTARRRYVEGQEEIDSRRVYTGGRKWF